MLLSESVMGLKFQCPNSCSNYVHACASDVEITMANSSCTIDVEISMSIKYPYRWCIPYSTCSLRGVLTITELSFIGGILRSFFFHLPKSKNLPIRAFAIMISITLSFDAVWYANLSEYCALSAKYMAYPQLPSRLKIVDQSPLLRYFHYHEIDPLIFMNDSLISLITASE